MHDVIVVGAGPAGNIAATNLAKSGLDVVLMDWRESLGDKLCTGIIGAECVRRFPPRKDLVHGEARAATVVSPDGSRYSIEKAETQGFIIDRVAYVASLADDARGAGAELQLGQRVTDVDVHGAGVTVRATGTDRSWDYDAKLAIIASGFGSPLMSMIGLQNGADQPYMIGAQAEVVAEGIDVTEVYLGKDVAPGSFGWVVPSAASRALVGVASRQELNGHLGGLISTLQEDGKVGEITRQPRRWGIPLKPIPRTYAGRVLVAGDAAGMVKPTTGGGIYYALLSGELAADVAAQAIAAGDVSARRLKSYEKSWKALFGREMRIGYIARTLYETLGDDQVDRLLSSLVSCDSRDGIISGDFSFDWHSRVILRAITHRDLGGVIRSFGPSVLPLLSRLLGFRTS